MSVISAPVNDRPVDFDAHDFEAFRLIFPPRLIGSPFVGVRWCQSRSESLESIGQGSCGNWPA